MASVSTVSPAAGSIFSPLQAESAESFESSTFQASFDTRPFAFQHAFTDLHPLFTLEKLRSLLNLPAVKQDIAYDAGEIRVDQRWDAMPPKPPIEEVFDNIHTSGAWIVMRRISRLPEYKEVLDSCLDEVQRLSGRAIEQDAKSREAMIFVTSPNRVTPYHIDRECNFLMQVKGTKTISVFDRNDKDVVPEQELETFWSRDNNAGVYKPHLQDRAFQSHMRPGTGVHIPVNFPHWLKNDDNVSVSLSISYQYRDWTRKNVYQANYYLRKMGLNPTPPGRSAALDYAKRAAIETLLRTKRILKPKK